MSAHDADYLKATVGPALVQAMTSMVVTQPPDAVDYLGNYLLAYVEREEGKAKQAARFKELDVAVAELAEKEAAAAAAEEARLEALKPGAEELALKEELATSTEIAPLYARVLEFAKAQTGATAVYIGKKEPGEGDVPVISFLAATDGCDMEGKSLKGKPEGDEEGAVEGVTFGLFDKRTDLPEEEEAPAEPEEGAVAEAKPKIDPYPTELFVSNVIREGNMKFFGIPMLGSYLTVPVKFSHLLHAEGVLELTEEEIKAEADAKAAAAAALEAAALEAAALKAVQEVERAAAQTEATRLLAAAEAAQEQTERRASAPKRNPSRLLLLPLPLATSPHVPAAARQGPHHSGNSA